MKTTKFAGQIPLFISFYGLSILVHTLHLQQLKKSQLQILKDKQKYIRDQVSVLKLYSININQQLKNANTDKDKVDILQNALNDQRQTVFDLKNKFLYPFNQSQTACKQLSDEQKTTYLSNINTTRNYLTKLDSINKNLDQSSPNVQKLDDEIKKQFILLQNIEDILNVKCKQNLSPTIFQSNLKSTNWILGPQTMDDLKQQYAQRALIFHNITNCPLETPFYNPKSENCIKCQQPNKLFNMFSKQCTKCIGEKELDIDKKNCIEKPHYTNYAQVRNWALDGAYLPQINKNLTPCPHEKSYFNGVICTVCELPSYWSVSSNSCKNCDNGDAFDLNTKLCSKIASKKLTILQNTKWISSNLTKIIQKRVSILEENKTTKNYEYCPDSQPYYDEITCIACEYFDIDKEICIDKPDGVQYDDNMKRFLPTDNNKQTLSTTTKYISASKLIDSDQPNCNSSYPYYDGINCIQCLKPFDIFNADQKKCVSCDYDEIYVENSHSCQLRKKIFVSQKFDRLLATPKMTVPQYKDSLIKLINNNPDAIISPCQSNQYSNQTDCLTCQQREYFDIQRLKCQQCDGSYDQNTKTCKQKVYIFTNLKASNLTDVENIDEENKKIAEFLKNHQESYICPIQKPYAIDNKTCGVCTDLFSYNELKCKSCAEFFIYYSNQRNCVQATMIVNFTDSQRILVNENQTLASFQSQEKNVKNQNPNNWKVCPGDRPFTDNRLYCFNCTKDNPYFNYTVKQCQNCPDYYIFDPVKVKCSQQYFITLVNSETEPRMLGFENYTMTNFKSDQQNYKKTNPTVNCNSTTPFGTSTGCEQCSQPTKYFNIKAKQCSDIKYFINFQKASPEYLMPNDKNLDYYILEQQKFKKQSIELTKKCPDITPYTTDRTECFNCQDKEYFSFQTRKCQKCHDGQAYMAETKSCKDLFYVTKISPTTELKMKGYYNYTLDNYKTEQNSMKSKNPSMQCSESSPYGTVSGCQMCQQPTPYFDIKKRICSSAKKLINFSSIGGNYILGNQKTLNSYQESEKKFKVESESLTVDCPSEAPFTSDRDSCFACQDPNKLFNFQTKNCQSCPSAAEFSIDQKKCLTLFYITNFNPESQLKMIQSSDYSIDDYKNQSQKFKKQNPSKDCTISQPYGTLEGCKKCVAPEEYFDIKNKACTAVKRVINFDSVGSNYLLGEGKELADYQKDEKSFEDSSDHPVLKCSSAFPFTSNRDDCFACSNPKIYFNFETKLCEDCGIGSSFSNVSKKCVKKQYYTFFSTNSEKFMLESQDYTFNQYKVDQLAIKGQKGGLQCPSTSPYSNSTGCLKCDSPTLLFNIKSQQCQSCENGKVFVDRTHQCSSPVYQTDFTNIYIKQSDNYAISDAQKAETERSEQPGFYPVKCSASQPFATLNGCIACNDDKARYFNIKTLACESCTDFYQYFQNRRCKDYIILTNTDKMMGYLEIDNYTKYNTEKMNNLTFISHDHVKECPSNTPFYSVDNICIACNSSQAPIFNLKQRKCTNIDSYPLSNPQYMKNYIETSDETMADLKEEIQYLKNKGVNIVLCPKEKPYLSHNQCILCPQSTKYFDLSTQLCKTCDSGNKCVTV